MRVCSRYATVYDLWCNRDGHFEWQRQKAHTYIDREIRYVMEIWRWRSAPVFFFHTFGLILTLICMVDCLRKEATFDRCSTYNNHINQHCSTFILNTFLFQVPYSFQHIQLKCYFSLASYPNFLPLVRAFCFISQRKRCSHFNISIFLGFRFFLLAFENHIIFGFVLSIILLNLHANYSMDSD